MTTVTTVTSAVTAVTSVQCEPGLAGLPPRTGSAPRGRDHRRDHRRDHPGPPVRGAAAAQPERRPFRPAGRVAARRPSCSLV